MTRVFITFILLLLPLLAFAASPPAPVAVTGQTIFYATGGDGDLQKGVGWPDPRFTDNNNGTVTDNLTGLTWLKNANCFGRLPWAYALNVASGLASGQCSLTDNSTVGSWRLPNINELKSLLDSGQDYPALPVNHEFINVVSNNYWSSTTISGLTDYAWKVVMSQGIIQRDHKTNYLWVWPVRGGE